VINLQLNSQLMKQSMTSTKCSFTAVSDIQKAVFILMLLIDLSQICTVYKQSLIHNLSIKLHSTPM